MTQKINLEKSSLEEFKRIYSDYGLGFTTNSQFVEQWENELYNKSLAFSSDIRDRINEARKRYEQEMQIIVKDIVKCQGWLAE